MTKVTYVISDVNKALAFEWIAERIDKARFQLSFVLIVQEPSILEAYLIKKEVPVYCFFYKNKVDLFLILPRLLRLLKRLQPDIVHCHLLYGSLLGLTAAWLRGVKIRIYTRHHSDFHHRYFPGGIKWDKWCNKLATKIVAPSRVVKEVLVELEEVPHDHVIIVPHGFDLDYFRNPDLSQVESLRKKFMVADHFPVIGTISRFTELKGIQYVIPAFIRLLDHYPHALILLFNATGDYEKEIKTLLNKIPECNYRLIPFEKDIAAVYHLFNIFVQASIDTRIESFGQTYVEALASGIPSIFTLSGIAPDFVVNESNAVVVPFKNSEAIYAGMMKILGNQEMKNRLTEAGWESVKDRFDLQKMLHQLMNLYG